MALNELIEELRARRLKEVAEKKLRRKETPFFPALKQPPAAPAISEEASSDRVRALVYKKIIERYSDSIGLFEEKTITELKALVNPEDEAIVKVKNKIFSELKGSDAAWEYSAEKHFLEFLKASLGYCFGLKPVNADLSISYWLKPSEIVELGAADPFDKAIFLCSLLESGGGSAKVRVLELEGGLKHAVVLCELDGKKLLLDPSCSDEFEAGASEEEVLQKHSLEGKRVISSSYEFNNQEYIDFEE